MHSAKRPGLTSRSLVLIRDFASKRPWLMLFVGLLGVLTLIGTNSLSAARGKEVINPESVTSNPSEAPAVKLPEMYVHVVGAVRSPGLYLLESGARLVDLITLAGGFTRLADQGSVNLARTLTDGEQVFVLDRSGAGSTSYVGAVATTGQSGAVPGSRISLNRATVSELESLPRVGPALAQRVIDWRTANGGFKVKEDLLKVAGFGDKMFAAIKDRVSL